MTVNEKAEIVDLFKRIRKYGNDMLEVLENGSEEAESYRVKVNGLVKILDDLKQLVPAQIYDAYAAFFSVFCDFCIQCENTNFLMENVDYLASSLALLVECLDAIIEEYVNKYKICACCGSLVRYIPLSSYYSEMKKNAGDFKESCPETLNKEEYHCPVCYASDRDRLIISFLEELQLGNAMEGESLLQIAPARTIEYWMHVNCTKLIYHSTDLFMEDVTFQSDIQDMNMVADGSYDFFICSHVLEHVEDDRKAMRELHRILKEDGIGIFLVPIDLNMTQTDEEWGLSEEENWRRFGQGDHCRKYARTDVITRLKEAGFNVWELGKEYFGEEVFFQCGLTDTSILYVLTKGTDSVEDMIAKRKKKRLEA